MKTMLLTILFISFTFFAFATATKKQVTIQIQSPAGYVDGATVYFDLGVSSAFAASQDAPKVLGNIAGMASIYSLSSDSIFCAINGYSTLTSSAVIPIGVKIDIAGNYAFTETMLSNFDSTSVIQLEDRQLHIFTNLGNNFYAVHIADTGLINGRFFLHIASAIQVSTVNSGCQNNDGKLNIYQDSSLTWTSASLYDLHNIPVAGLNNISGTYSFGNLPEGDYRLVLVYNGDYITSRQIHLAGNYVAAHIQPLAFTALVAGQNTFKSTTVNATTYFWDFGEGSEINDIANPTFAFMQPGIFTVVLLCSNAYGCQSEDSVTVTVSETTGINSTSAESRNIWAYSKTVTVVLSEEIKQGAAIKIYSLLGQPVYDSQIDQATSSITLNDTPDGYYIVSLLNNGVTSTKSVILTK